jgi:hypothetical protein
MLRQAVAGLVGAALDAVTVTHTQKVTTSTISVAGSARSWAADVQRQFARGLAASLGVASDDLTITGVAEVDAAAGRRRMMAGGPTALRVDFNVAGPSQASATQLLLQGDLGFKQSVAHQVNSAGTALRLSASALSEPKAPALGTIFKFDVRIEELEDVDNVWSKLAPANAVSIATFIPGVSASDLKVGIPLTDLHDGACASNPCKNGAACHGGVAVYMCGTPVGAVLILSAQCAAVSSGTDIDAQPCTPLSNVLPPGFEAELERQLSNQLCLPVHRLRVVNATVVDANVVIHFEIMPIAADDEISQQQALEGARKLGLGRPLECSSRNVSAESAILGHDIVQVDAGDDSKSMGCPGGYMGRTCDTDVDECASTPCRNGATCTSNLVDQQVSAGTLHSFACGAVFTIAVRFSQLCLVSCSMAATRTVADCPAKQQLSVSALPAGFSTALLQRIVQLTGLPASRVQIGTLLSEPCRHAGTGCGILQMKVLPPVASSREAVLSQQQAAQTLTQFFLSRVNHVVAGCISLNIIGTERSSGIMGCPLGFSGLRCEVSDRGCQNSALAPCQNGGVCDDGNISGATAVSCRCSGTSWSGEYCEIPLLPCQNGIRVVSRVGGVECRCEHGWQGRSCTEWVNPCHSLQKCPAKTVCSQTGPGMYECRRQPVLFSAVTYETRLNSAFVYATHRTMSAAEAAFEQSPRPHGFCTALLPDASTLRNQDICPQGSTTDIAYKISFTMSIGFAGVYSFRLAVDWSEGVFVCFETAQQGYGTEFRSRNDADCQHHRANKFGYVVFSSAFVKTNVVITLLGASGCCDQQSSLEVSLPHECSGSHSDGCASRTDDVAWQIVDSTVVYNCAAVGEAIMCPLAGWHYYRFRSLTYQGFSQPSRGIDGQHPVVTLYGSTGVALNATTTVLRVLDKRGLVGRSTLYTLRETQVVASYSWRMQSPLLTAPTKWTLEASADGWTLWTTISSVSSPPAVQPTATRQPCLPVRFGVFQETMTMQAAESACNYRGGHLASLHSLMDKNEVQQLMWQSSITSAWIGSRLQGCSNGVQLNYSWTDGTPSGMSLTPSYLLGSAPSLSNCRSAECAAVENYGVSWAAKDCALSLPFVCGFCGDADQSLSIARTNVNGPFSTVCTASSEPFNVARSASVHGSFSSAAWSLVNNGVHALYEVGRSPRANVSGCSERQHVTLDLQREMMLDSVTLWHRYEPPGIRYCGQAVAVSLTGAFTGEEIVVYNTYSSYGPPETPGGNRVTFTAVAGRFVRHWCSGSTQDMSAEFLEVAAHGFELQRDSKMQHAVEFGCIDHHTTSCTYDANAAAVAAGAGRFSDALAAFTACASSFAQPDGFCHVQLDRAVGLSNRVACQSTVMYNIAYHTVIPFTIKMAGVYHFRFHVDYGKGGFIGISRSMGNASYHAGDIWGHVLMEDIYLDVGDHFFEALGFEGCCDDGHSELEVHLPCDRRTDPWRMVVSGPSATMIPRQVDGAACLGEEVREPHIRCGETVARQLDASSMAADKVLPFTVSRTQNIQFDSCNSTVDTFLRVFTSDRLVELASCDNCGPCGKQDVVDVRLDPGNYVLLVGTISVSNTSTIDTANYYAVKMNCGTGLHGSITCGETVRGEPVEGELSSFQHFYTITAYSRGRYSFNSCGSVFPTQLAMFDRQLSAVIGRCFVTDNTTCNACTVDLVVGDYVLSVNSSAQYSVELSCPSSRSRGDSAIVFSPIQFQSRQSRFVMSSSTTFAQALTEFFTGPTDTTGYCRAVVTGGARLRNQDICPQGRTDDIAFHIYVQFVVKQIGVYNFRVRINWSGGAFLCVDRACVRHASIDANIPSSPHRRMQQQSSWGYVTFDRHLLPGNHELELVGFERCCDSHAEIQLSLPVECTATESACSSPAQIFDYIDSTALYPCSKVSSFISFGEVGRTSVDHRSTVVQLQRRYANPVVIVGVPSYAGSHAITMRVRQVTNSSFTMFAQETRCLDTSHVSESVSWMVIESGKWSIETNHTDDGDGMAIIEANSLTLAHFGWQRVTFSHGGLVETPVALSQVQTINGPQFVKTRQRNADRSGFDIRLEEDGLDLRHNRERVGWVSLPPRTGRVGLLAFQASTTGRVV